MTGIGKLLKKGECKLERTVLLDNMKKIDNIFLVCWILLLGCFIALYSVGEVAVTTYFFALFLGVNLVLLIYIIINRAQNKRFRETFETSFEAVYSGDYSAISDSTDNEIFILVNSVAAEAMKSKEDVKIMLKLASAIEKDEISSFSENSPNKNVNNAIRIIKNIEKENEKIRKISTEFFKNIKTGKFNDIDVDSENITQQQLNTILHSMYTMNTNLRIVQSAIFQGVYGVELETDNVEGDFLNVTNKLTTMLKSVEKASANLKKGILLMDESGYEEFISSAYKGNLVECFKALEVVYENINMSIDNIAYSLENNAKIDFDNVSELFNPIVKAINGGNLDKYFEENLKDNIEEGEPKFKEIKKYNTASIDLISDIENNLKSIQSTIETSELEFALLNTIEELKDDSQVEVSEESQDLENSENVEGTKESQELENVEKISETDEKQKLEDSEELEVTEIIEEIEEVQELDNTKEIEDTENIQEVDEKEENQEHVVSETVEVIVESSEVENISVDSVEEVIEEESREETLRKYLSTKEFNNSEKQDTFKPKSSILNRNNKETKADRGRFAGETTNTRKGVQTMESSKDRNSKKPLTYQEAIRSGRVEEPQKTTSVSTKKQDTLTPIPTQRKAVDNKNKKEPMTYQKFLEKGTRPSDPNNSGTESQNTKQPFDSGRTERTLKTRLEVDRNSSNTTNTREQRNSDRQTPRGRARDSALQEIDPTKKRSKLEENLGRKLSQKERTELDLYGEILDDKTRATLDIITDANDLGGF